MDKEYEKRKEFIEVYSDFNKWLHKIGFESDKSLRSTHLDFHYSWYDEKIDNLWGVEHYINERLNFSIRFLRGRYEHVFMIVGEMGSFSKIFTIEEFKEIIKNEVIRIRDEKLAELNYFKFL